MDGEFDSASNEYPLGILLVDSSPRKTRNRWKNVMMMSSSHFHHHVFSCISCFSWSKVHQTYVKWVLIGCRIEFPIQKVLLIEIWEKTHGDKFKIWIEKVVFSLVYFFIILTFYSTLLLFYLKKWWFIPYGWNHHLESYWFL